MTSPSDMISDMPKNPSLMDPQARPTMETQTSALSPTLSSASSSFSYG